MPRLNGRLRVLGWAFGLIAMTGCGDATLSTQYVEGLLTVDGKPVPAATVMFVPVTEGQGAIANGTTDENGLYKLTAVTSGEPQAEPEAGTLPGEYYVGVIKSVSEAAMSEEEAYEKKIPYVAPQPGVVPKTTHVVPVKYNDPKQSGLKVTVKEGKNTLPLELTSS